MSSTAVGDALFTRTQQRVLGLLYGTPDRSFYTNEIMRRVDMGRGTVRRELDRLVSADLITVSQTGNQRHYQANPESPVYAELLGLVRKTFGIADVIREALAPLLEQIELAFLYGSMAKASDVDLMLIGKNLVYADIMDLLVAIEASLQRTINPTIYTTADFRNKLKRNNGFLTRVMDQPRMMIKGVINDFREPAADQAAPR